MTSWVVKRILCWLRGHNFPSRDVRGDAEGVKAGNYDRCWTCGALRA